VTPLSVVLMFGSLDGSSSDCCIIQEITVAPPTLLIFMVPRTHG